MEIRLMKRYIFQTLVVITASVFLFACKAPKVANSSSKSESVSKREKEREERAAKETATKLRERQIHVALSTAYSFAGTPYKMGGMDKRGMDCSGLVNVCYKEAGIPLPRTTTELSAVGTPVQLEEVDKGDLLFFATKHKSSSITHVGIVTKVESKEKVYFIHASNKLGVVEDNLAQKYYRETFVKAIRPF